MRIGGAKPREDFAHGRRIGCFGTARRARLAAGLQRRLGGRSGGAAGPRCCPLHLHHRRVITRAAASAKASRPGATHLVHPTEREIFAARIVPYRSLSRRNFRLLVMLFSGASFFTSLPFGILGAWPIAGF